ncbi:MAG: HD family phosphohydrolase [Chthonomonadales bacterium]
MVTSRSRRRHPSVWRSRLQKPSLDTSRTLLGFGTVLGLFIVMSVHFMPDKISLKVGERSPVEIRANRSVSYVDTEATLRHRQFAAERVGRVYDFDGTAQAQAASTVTELFREVARLRSRKDRGSATAGRESTLVRLSALFAPREVRYLASSPPAAIARLEADARRLVDAQMDAPIRTDTDDLAHARALFSMAAKRVAANSLEERILSVVGEQALRPNQIFDRRKTEQMREAAWRSAAPITGEVRLGDVIIHQGEVFTQQHLDKCRALGLISPRIDLATAASIFGLALGMVFLAGLYIRRANPAVYADPRQLFLLSLTVLLSVLGLRVFGTLFGITLSGMQFGYLGMMTVVSAGMLITVLLDAPLATLITALLSVQTGLIISHEVRFTVMTLVSGLVGIFSVSNIRDRSHLLKATLSIAAANVALVWLLGGLLGDTLREVLLGSVWALAAAAIAIAIFWFGVAVLEKPFGILTHVWLLELSSSERPLLRELCIKAPGTYAHSIMVGNLAEAAAEAVGANALFCRVASYYHDIGKMRRPHCFVENQRAGNIHERLNPSLSALIIASHVRDGLHLADEHRLPRQIKAIIAEHHGTSLIRYFYNQAVIEGCGGVADPVLEQHFRYDGPKPQTRESGIIMLADSVEAAARCLDRPTPARLQNLVDALVREKLADGQLDECDLTLKDIRTIQASFVRVLSGMLHNRIDYPDLPRPEAVVGWASQRNGSMDPEPAEAAVAQTASSGGGAAGPGP